MWAGGSRPDPGDAPTLASVRFFPRGEGAIWLDDENDPPLSANGEAVREALERIGALFIADIQAATGLTSLSVRDALRELSALTLVTNDSIEALREVVRTRSIPGRSRAARGPGLQDPTRWLPDELRGDARTSGVPAGAEPAPAAEMETPRSARTGRVGRALVAAANAGHVGRASR